MLDAGKAPALHHLDIDTMQIYHASAISCSKCVDVSNFSSGLLRVTDTMIAMRSSWHKHAFSCEMRR